MTHSHNEQQKLFSAEEIRLALEEISEGHFLGGGRVITPGGSARRTLMTPAEWPTAPTPPPESPPLQSKLEELFSGHKIEDIEALLRHLQTNGIFEAEEVAKPEIKPDIHPQQARSCRARIWNHRAETQCNYMGTYGGYCKHHQKGTLNLPAMTANPASKPSSASGHPGLFFGNHDEYQAGYDPKDEVLPFMDKDGWLRYWWESNDEIWDSRKRKYCVPATAGDATDDHYKQCKIMAEAVLSGRCKIPPGFPKRRDMKAYRIPLSAWPRKSK